MDDVREQNKRSWDAMADSWFGTTALSAYGCYIPTEERLKLFPDLRGKRVLLMDDVISTGGSLHAMEELVALAGGIVAGRVAVLAEGDAQKREDIKFLAPLPLFNADGTVKGE